MGIGSSRAKSRGAWTLVYHHLLKSTKNTQYLLYAYKIMNILYCILQIYTIDNIPIFMSVYPRPSSSINRCPRRFLMSAQPLATLNEPSLADAIAHIERSEALRVGQRSHWTCSMRFVARALDRPPSLIPARWPAIRYKLEERHPSQLDVTAKTFANHRANLRAALSLFRGEKNIPQHGHRLSEPWSSLWASVEHLPTRMPLSRFFRYLSANAISARASRRRGCRRIPSLLGKDRPEEAQHAKPTTARSRMELSPCQPAFAEAQLEPDSRCFGNPSIQWRPTALKPPTPAHRNGKPISPRPAPTASLKGLRVYMSHGDDAPAEVLPPARLKSRWQWCERGGH
jgi:hypothetical protein